MKFLIAPNAFKGTIEAEKAAWIIQDAILNELSDAELEICPIADGGDGTCLLLGKQLNLTVYKFAALNPIGRPVPGFVFLNKSQRTAYLDVSTVSGIKWLKSHEVEARVTSSFGTGELILKAMEEGAQHLVLGLGGSATVDMGTGILRAMGFVFLDQRGREIPMFSPGFLSRIAHIQRPVKPLSVRFTCLCDVRNSFFGKEGAIPVFGPQKGLKPEDLNKYEQDARHFFDLLRSKSDFDLVDQAGFGAAGGIALGLSAFFSVKIEEGAKFFFDQVEMERKIEKADWIITGEGKYDAQSAGGKGSFELLQLAKNHGKQIILITSGMEGGKSGFDEVIRLKDLDFKSADFKEQAEKNLYEGVSVFIREKI
ncbi:MAG: glycerate kinase [Anditalea sp.]